MLVCQGRYVDQFADDRNYTEEFHWYTNVSQLIIPDTSIEQPSDSFIWCTPIPARDWNTLVGLAVQFKCVTPNGVLYVHRIGARRQRIIIVPWHPAGTDTKDLHRERGKGHSKEEIEQECAWLRLIKNFQHPIYVVPHGVTLTTKEIIQRSMNVSPYLLQSLDSLKDVPDDPS